MRYFWWRKNTTPSNNGRRLIEVTEPHIAKLKCIDAGSGIAPSGADRSLMKPQPAIFWKTP